MMCSVTNHTATPTKTPLAAKIEAALASLTRPVPIATAFAIACHVALPTTDLLGMQARVVRGVLSWRTLELVLPDEVSDPGASATPLIKKNLADFLAQLERAYATSDQFINTMTDPVTWIKVVRSGSRLLVVGPDLLFGTPPLTADLDVDQNYLPAVVDHLRTSRDYNSRVDPLELHLTGTRDGVLVSRVTPRTQISARTQPAPQLLADLGVSIAQEIAGDLVTYVDLAEPDSHLSHVEYVIGIGDVGGNGPLEALIAAHVDAHGAAAIGYPGAWVPAPAMLGPWKVLGNALHEPGLVATHSTSYLRALLRPRTLTY